MISLLVPSHAQIFLLFEVPNGKLSDNHMRATVLSFLFLQMRAVRPKKTHNLSKVWGLAKNDAFWLLNLHSPNHSTLLPLVKFPEEEPCKGTQRLNAGKLFYQGKRFQMHRFLFSYFPNSPRCLEQWWFKYFISTLLRCTSALSLGTNLRVLSSRIISRVKTHKRLELE